MICLAANTATTVLSVALLRDGSVLDSYETTETREQGNLLLLHAGNMLKGQGLSYNDVDLFAVCTGPGSFTGIRIGLAALRGLALAAGKPVVGVDSFAMFGPDPDPRYADLVAVESWREELYFRLTGPHGEEVIPPVNETPDALAMRLKALNLTWPVRISGDAVDKVAPLVGGPCVVVPQGLGAAAIGRKAIKNQKLENKKPIPFYLREADVTIKAS